MVFVLLVIFILPGWLTLHLARVHGLVLVLEISLPTWVVDPASCKGVHVLVLVLEISLPTWVVDPASCKGYMDWFGTGDIPPFLGG
jgi:hypothetical protein